jgi:hypothetical protein
LSTAASSDAVLEAAAGVGQAEAARRIGLARGDDPLEGFPRGAGIAPAQRLDGRPGEARASIVEVCMDMADWVFRAAKRF